MNLKELKERYERAVAKRAELAAEIKIKREQLVDLIEEMKAAGVQPDQLDSEMEKAKAELDTALIHFEKELETVEKAYKLA